jgi:hypothetical protein
LWLVFFEIGSQELFTRDWLWTAILISVFWVARIIGVKTTSTWPKLCYINNE